MTTGFAILAHDDPKMLGRLVSTLEGAPIVVHLDLRVDLEGFESVAKILERRDVTYSSSRIRVNWGGSSAVAAMLACASDVIEHLGPDEHVVFLSGRCYPIRPVADFSRHLGNSPWSQHCRAYDLSSLGDWHVDRYQLRHDFDGIASRLGPHGSFRRRLVRNGTKLMKRVLPRVDTELQVVAGSQWMALTRSCFEAARCTVISPKYAALRNGYATDEMMFQTFVHNSEWGSRTEFGGPEVLTEGKVSSIPNFHQLDREMKGTVSRDAVLKPGEREFFARKFDSARDRELLDAIDLAQSHH